MKWADVSAVLGLVLLAILGGYLKVLPDKLVAALVMAAVGYYGARTALARREKKAEKAEAQRQFTQERETTRAAEELSDGAVARELDAADSGVIEVAPQTSGRIVRVRADGSCTIGPAREPGPHDKDDTPVDRRNPALDEDDEGA
jgi:hypothetical protein